MVADCLLAESTSPGRPSAVCRRPHRCQDAGQAKMMMTPCNGKWKWLWLTVMKVKVKTVDSRSKANKPITDSVLSQFCHSSGRSGKMVMTICNESEHYIKTYTLSFYCPIVVTPLLCCPKTAALCVRQRLWRKNGEICQICLIVILVIAPPI